MVKSLYCQLVWLCQKNGEGALWVEDLLHVVRVVKGSRWTRRLVRGLSSVVFESCEKLSFRNMCLSADTRLSNLAAIRRGGARGSLSALCVIDLPPITPLGAAGGDWLHQIPVIGVGNTTQPRCVAFCLSKVWKYGREYVMGFCFC